MDEKGAAWTLFHSIATVILIIILLLIGFVFMSGMDFTGSFEHAEEQSEKVPILYATPEAFCTEERMSDHRVIYVNSTPDGRSHGNRVSLHKFNVVLGCEIPGTHESGATCLIDYFASWQWVENGCEIQLHNKNLGYFEFQIPDTLTGETEFTYPCTGSDKHSNYRWWMGCYERYRWYADMERFYDKVMVILNPLNNTKVNVSFWDMNQIAILGMCSHKKVSCEGGEFCRGDISHNFYGWGIESKGRLCCPPKEVRNATGSLLLDENGNLVEETWVWDTTLTEDGTCCIDSGVPERFCENMECEDKGGVWIHGSCWFKGDGNCNSICSAYRHDDGARYVCSPPIWERVPKECYIHGLLGYSCDSCQAGPNDRLSPYVQGGSVCYYQNNYGVDEAQWCGTNSNNRLCACL
ncbi:MAG: hypothetical protein JSV92_01055 [archaeon]|nr:MAG: hypothetical protein JSV92_01055 [archaeon]